MKTFPKPLTLEEEQTYIKSYQEGSAEAKNVLIERNLRLVAHIVKKYQSQEDDTDDLISVGTIGLIKAVNTFDSSKGNKLATYAARCIDNELLMHFRSKKKISKDVSLYEPIGTDKEGNEISLLDIIEAETKDLTYHIELRENVIRLHRFFQACLSPREQHIMELRYGLYGNTELTQREIAKQLRISRSYVSRIEKKALEKLRLCFQKENAPP